MLDLKTALADQDDIRALIARRFEKSPELYWPNDNYGMARVLKTYAGYPVDEPLHALVLHGIVWADDYVFVSEVDVPYPVVLNYPDYRQAAWERLTQKTAIPSASPFLYALALMEAAPSIPGEGMVFFPAHSTAAVQHETDYYDVASRLRKLPDEYHPITVCVHWFDVEQKIHKVFERRGFPVVCAGHLADPDFLFRLIHIFREHRYAGSSDLGSNLFYAVAAGLPYYLMDVPHRIRLDPSTRHLYEVQISPERQRDLDRIRGLFAALPTEITAEQRQVAEYYTGLHHFKTPADLLTDLEYARDLARG